MRNLFPGGAIEGKQVQVEVTRLIPPLQDGAQLLLVIKRGLQRQVELFHHKIQDELAAAIFARPKSNDTLYSHRIMPFGLDRHHVLAFFEVGREVDFFARNPQDNGGLLGMVHVDESDFTTDLPVGYRVEQLKLVGAADIFAG